MATRTTNQALNSLLFKISPCSAYINSFLLSRSHTHRSNAQHSSKICPHGHLPCFFSHCSSCFLFPKFPEKWIHCGNNKGFFSWWEKTESEQVYRTTWNTISQYCLCCS